MSITSIYQCKNLSGMIHYCITPKKQQKGERVASMYSDLGNHNMFLNYGIETTKAHKRKVQAFTLLQSFPSTEFDVDNAEHISCVNELGRKLAYELFPNSPCLVITHADSDGKCLHNHIAVINHDLASNGCIKTNRHYRYVRQANDKIMEKYGLEICESAVQKQTQREYWTNKRNHWLDELKVKVDNALSHSISIKEFQDNLLLEGISATFYKSNGELKEHFTFMVRDSDGKEHKKRSDKLGEEYTRNALQQKLLYNKKEREQKAIMPMSQWIEIQKEKFTQVELLSNPGNKIVLAEKCDEVPSKTEPIECFIGSLKEPSLRDKVLAYLIEKIYIYEDKVVINFYYSEDNREINLEEFNKYLDNLGNIMEKLSGEGSFNEGQIKINAMWESIIAGDEGEASF